jgi:hypothetical protein
MVEIWLSLRAVYFVRADSSLSGAGAFLPHEAIRLGRNCSISAFPIYG